MRTDLIKLTIIININAVSSACILGKAETALTKTMPSYIILSGRHIGA